MILYLLQEVEDLIESKELALYIARIAKDNKAQKLVVLDLRALVAFCDFFVIMSATSGRQITGVAGAIEQELYKHKIKPLFRGSKAQTSDSGWLVLDYAGVVVHIFQQSQREFYSLEHLWQDAKRVRIPSSRKKNEKRQSLPIPLIPNKRLSKTAKSR